MFAHWLALLQKYDYDTVHQAGKLHTNAYGLSRCHTCQNPQCLGREQDMVEGHRASDVEMFMQMTASRLQREQPIKICIAEVCSATLAEDSDFETDTKATPREKLALGKLDQQLAQQLAIYLHWDRQIHCSTGRILLGQSVELGPR